ncbi:hypothetical protein [Streptomyces sp. NPDC089799]|uniref:hypothetical protein n=1 Tax=Streptomyces sp. NPDC089799 TaxID=3155066 RepID=UPI00342D9B96
MPHTQHRALARERAFFTGETPATAAAETTRSGSLGIDDCSPAQRRLRALLALAVFNTGPLSAGLWTTSLADLSAYTVVMSPRRDKLVLISNAPDNIATRLLPRDDKQTLCLPGMRLLRLAEHGAAMLHLPTGAVVLATSRRDGTLDDLADERHSHWTTDHPMTDRESILLASLPHLTADTETLLAAVFVRMWMRSADWDLAGWFCPAASRNDDERALRHYRRLDGAGDHWSLTWTSWPHPDDLVAALTHPAAGLASVTVVRHPGYYEAHYGTASLRLDPRTHS